MRYAVIRENDSLSHAQHAGYYSPNNGSGNDYKRDRYLFQGVFRVENHGDAEIDLINSRDNTQARTKVPGRIIESGKTAIVNYLVRKSNSRASIDAGQARLAADAIERYVQSHFNTELRHSDDDDDDVIESDDYLEHAQHEGYYSPNLTKNTTTIEQYPYKIGKCYITRDGNRMDSYRALMHVVLVNKNGKAGRMPDFIIALHRHKDAVSAVDSFLNTVRNSYPSYWRQAPDSIRHEIIKQAISLYYKYQDKPQHEGYYSPNLSHSYDYLEHHGVLGMKWGVRRYQNEDGSLTEEGKKRYTNKDGSYVDNESRQAIKKEISKRKGMAGASSVLGSALLSSVILNPAVLAMPVAGLVLPAAIAATSAASLINNIKSMQLSQIKDRADMIDFHRSGNEPVEPIRVNVRRR